MNDNSRRETDGGPQRRCPICGKAAEPALRPFCSRRCADIDLSRWLSGVYAIAIAGDDDEDGEQPVAQPAGETEGKV